MKKVVAVPPYVHKGIINFRKPAFDAWKELGGQIASPHYPWRFLHGLVDRYELPQIYHRKEIAQLRFIQPINRRLDATPECMTTEIIPMIWDCWPCLYDRMESWMRHFKVHTAIFTSSQEMEDMKKRIPELNVLYCPEAVNTDKYSAGQELKDRSIDILEFGRINSSLIDTEHLDGINHICTKVGNKFIYTDEQLFKAMGDAKVTICVPRCMVDPVAGGVETLTQRYWEAMLTRMVIIGHCPKELEDLIGYNPVIELSFNANEQIEAPTIQKQIMDILEHIEDYQPLVNRNREVALKMGDWRNRMSIIRDWLNDLGYIAQ